MIILSSIKNPKRMVYPQNIVVQNEKTPDVRK